MLLEVLLRAVAVVLVAAGRAGLGATIGLVLGAAIKISLGLTMVAIYALVRLAGAF